jgi:hypothetical protein
MPLTTALRPTTLTDKELVVSLRAGKTWSRIRDVPDIVGLADFVHAPEQALPALRSRLAVFPAHRNSTPFPLPKPSGKHRALLYADPIDEAIYRAAVGRIAPTVDDGLGPEVQSYRLRRAARRGSCGRTTTGTWSDAHRPRALLPRAPSGLWPRWT